MKLSIIIPVFNARQYLPRCIDSIRSIAGPDVEIVCIDDGSTDGGCNVPNGVKLIRQDHEGVVMARRRGFMASSGEYVWFVDADDEIVKIPEIPNADIVRYFQNYGWMCIGDKIYRRDVISAAFDDIGHLRLNSCEDGLMYLAAKKYARQIVDVPETIYRYVRRAGSASLSPNMDIVSDKEIFLREWTRLEPGMRIADESRDAVVHIVSCLCRWPIGWRGIWNVSRELSRSWILRECIKSKRYDGYAQRMVWAARHPWLIALHRIFRRLRNWI